MTVDDDPDAAGNCLISLSQDVTEPSNCDKYRMCAMMCQCDAGGCYANNELTNAVDIAFDGASANGGINFGLDYNLRLTRGPI